MLAGRLGLNAAAERLLESAFDDLLELRLVQEVGACAADLLRVVFPNAWLVTTTLDRLTGPGKAWLPWIPPEARNALDDVRY